MNSKSREFGRYPYAAKKEEKGLLPLNLGVEEQAMVIIRRDLTVEAQKREDARRKYESEKAEKEAAAQKAKAAAAQKAKSEAERQRKASDDMARKKEQIRRLEKENAALRSDKEKAEKELKIKKDAAKNAKNDISRKAKDDGAVTPKESKAKEENLTPKVSDSKNRKGSGASPIPSRRPSTSKGQVDTPT